MARMMIDIEFNKSVMRLGLRCIGNRQQHIGMTRLGQWAPTDQILPAKFRRGKAERKISDEGLDSRSGIRD
jgi:hypothetical protein